jgi:protein tyrosine phosphatase
MSTFFKRNIVYITENAVNPDMRRNAVKGEAAKHYIDIDVYGDSALWKMPRRWTDAVAKYSEDTLQAYGIVPWEVNRMKYSLQKAFEKHDTKAILRIASDMGHYIADSNVPLHTTQNYNGQMSGQKGIHGFWESRLPELYSDKYDYFVGAAEYENRSLERSWKGVTEAHLALDSVLRFEKELNARWPEDKKYSFEQRGNTSVQVYSREYSAAYHRMLGRQVENRMRASVKEVADLWYTAWVDAGQPDLNQLLDYKLSEEDIKEMEEEQKLWQQKTLQVRPEETSSLREFGETIISGSLCCREEEAGHGH